MTRRLRAVPWFLIPSTLFPLAAESQLKPELPQPGLMQSTDVIRKLRAPPEGCGHHPPWTMHLSLLQGTVSRLILFLPSLPSLVSLRASLQHESSQNTLSLFPIPLAVLSLALILICSSSSPTFGKHVLVWTEGTSAST